MDPEHARHVALWLAEVFGGPPDVHRGQRGGYPYMMPHHLGLGITEPQRRRWVNLMMDAADEVGLPGDPEFRAAFAGYVEWGTRLALANSQPGATPPPRARRFRLGLGRRAAVRARVGGCAARTTRRCWTGPPQAIEAIARGGGYPYTLDAVYVDVAGGAGGPAGRRQVVP